MAMGNIGNLLQHFVGLTVANRLVSDWNQPQNPIEYIDCFSMGPWETLDGSQPQGFVAQVERFPALVERNDLTARAFMAAWSEKYGADEMPARPLERLYPNTAVLLRHAFPGQHWNMRLHDIDEQIRADLDSWGKQENVLKEFRVHGDWSRSPAIHDAPAPEDRPVLLMLDPYRIVPDDPSKVPPGGYLSQAQLRFLTGTHALNLTPANRDGAPCVVVLLSFSDAYPDVPDRVVRKAFDNNGWRIERVQVSVRARREAFHQAWIVSCGVEAFVPSGYLQGAWHEWLNGV
jgi:hypothetical protein